MSSITTQIKENQVDNLLSGLIASKTRIKLLMRLFFNPKARSYLRELAKEFNVSTNAVREELNQLTKTELLTSHKSGRQVMYQANQNHPLFPETTGFRAGCVCCGFVLALDLVWKK